MRFKSRLKNSFWNAHWAILVQKFQKFHFYLDGAFLVEKAHCVVCTAKVLIHASLKEVK